jgi:anti-anti-sigma factor
MRDPEPPILFFEYVEPEPGVVKLVLKGECDLSEAPRLTGAIESIAPGAREVHLDLRGLEFLDSTTLRVLCRAKADLESAGSKLVLLDPTPAIRRVIEIAGLWDFFRMEDGSGTREDGSAQGSPVEATAP